MAALFAQLDIADLRGSLPTFTAATKQLVDRYGAASATLAARFYQQQRRHAGITGPFTPKPAPLPALGEVKAAVDFATRQLWSAQPDLPNTQTALQGVAETMVLNTGRSTVIDTVRADRKAKGWARIPEPGCCAFCALLATRGAVYRESTVGFHTHPSCRCHVEPVFTAYEPSAEVRRLQQVYRESTASLSGNKARLAFRQALHQN